jgi:hypothetical protein
MAGGVADAASGKGGTAAEGAVGADEDVVEGVAPGKGGRATVDASGIADAVGAAEDGDDGILGNAGILEASGSFNSAAPAAAGFAGAAASGAVEG